MDKKIVITFIGVILIAIVFFTVKKCNKQTTHASPALVISPDTLFAGQTISYSDTGLAVTTYEWNFGDETAVSKDQSGTHQYVNDGKYHIRLKYNNSDSVTYNRTIVVLKKPVEMDTSQFDIEGPSEAFVNQQLTFKAAVPGKAASVYEWRFGESGTIDSREKNATYSFGKPDSYEISLRVNNSKRFAKKMITIKAHTAGVFPSIGADDLENLFKRYVNAIEDAEHDATKKKIIQYFCGSNSSKVKVKNNSETSLQQFLTNIDMAKNTVKVLTITKDKTSGCISVLEVQLK